MFSGAPQDRPPDMGGPAPRDQVCQGFDFRGNTRKPSTEELVKVFRNMGGLGDGYLAGKASQPVKPWGPEFEDAVRQSKLWGTKSPIPERENNMYAPEIPEEVITQIPAHLQKKYMLFQELRKKALYDNLATRGGGTEVFSPRLDRNPTDKFLLHMFPGADDKYVAGEGLHVLANEKPPADMPDYKNTYQQLAEEFGRSGGPWFKRLEIEGLKRQFAKMHAPPPRDGWDAQWDRSGREMHMRSHIFPEAYDTWNEFSDLTKEGYYTPKQREMMDAAKTYATQQYGQWDTNFPKNNM
jgi:hypothetical protein